MVIFFLWKMGSPFMLILLTNILKIKYANHWIFLIVPVIKSDLRLQLCFTKLAFHSISYLPCWGILKRALRYIIFGSSLLIQNQAQLWLILWTRIFQTAIQLIHNKKSPAQIVKNNEQGKKSVIKIFNNEKCEKHWKINISRIL